MIKTIALLLVLGASPAACTSTTPAVSNAEDACAVVKARITAQHHLPESRAAFCDPIAAADGLQGYYVMALHSDRECEGICSTNMGWFAVQQSTGDVFEWNVADWELGQEIAPQP